MPDSNIIQIDQNLFETKLDRLVTEKMTQILNAMLDAEADEITGAARYERKEGRKAYRAGHYERTLTAKAGRLELRVPKLKGAVFESAVIERYRRRESSVEEALMEMYLAGVSTRQVDDISKLLWGDRMPSQTLSDKLKRVYDDIDRWRTRPLESEYPYVFMDGVWHKRSWGGSVENVSVLVAIGVNAEGHREVIGVTEGMREDAASWEQFIRSMIERGLKGVRLVVGDRCAGLVSTVNSMLPRAKYQRCMVHFMRNVLSKVPPNHRDWASAALKAIFAMESRESALAKAGTVAAEMESRKLKAAAGCLREGIGETTAYLLPEFPTEHRRRIRTNNMIERLNRDSTCPGSMTTCRKRTDHRPMDGHDPKCANLRALPVTVVAFLTNNGHWFVASMRRTGNRNIVDNEHDVIDGVIRRPISVYQSHLRCLINIVYPIRPIRIISHVEVVIFC